MSQRTFRSLRIARDTVDTGSGLPGIHTPGRERDTPLSEVRRAAQSAALEQPMLDAVEFGAVTIAADLATMGCGPGLLCKDRFNLEFNVVRVMHV